MILTGKEIENAMLSHSLNDLYRLVTSIPAGRVCSYGQVGRALQNPVSGLLVGRWMSNCPPDLPWWRVVAADGTLPVWKKDPTLAVIQHDRLAEEGVEFDAQGKVRMDPHRWEGI